MDDTTESDPVTNAQRGWLPNKHQWWQLSCKTPFSSNGDIYVSNGQSNSKLPNTINSEDGEHDPFIAQDESFLIVVRQIADLGDSNMFISFKQNNEWSKLIKLPAPSNLDKIDGSPYVTR